MSIRTKINFVFILATFACFGASFCVANDQISHVTIANDPGTPIPPAFLGLSYEKSILSIPFFTDKNQQLVALFKSLGPGVLRIGANAVNTTTWDPNGLGLTAGHTAQSDIVRLAGFLRASNWKVIYGLNGTTSPPTESTAEAAYAINLLGDRLIDLEIGNEPDLYHQNGLEASSFGFPDFLKSWTSYFTDIRRNYPSAPFSGPATSYNLKEFTLPFAQQEHQNITQLTDHYYRANGQSPTSTIDLLLADDPGLTSRLQALSAAVSQNQIHGGFRIAETNSFYNGGALGISNAFGSSLWAIEFCFKLAQYGSQGVNFHGGGNSTGYTPIANDQAGNIVEIRPEFYGIFLFAQMANGDLLPTKVSGAASFLHAYAVRTSGGTIMVALVNNSRTENVSVDLDMPHVPQSPRAAFLMAPSLDSAKGVTFGSVTIGLDGNWTPTFQNLSKNGETISVIVPPGTAVLIE